MNKACFFDVDGVLSKGYWLFDQVEKLFEKGLFHKESHKNIFKAFDEYNRGKLTYNEGNAIVSRNYALGLRGFRVSDVLEVSSQLYKKTATLKIFHYTGDLMKFLKENCFAILLITSSPDSIIRFLAEDLSVEFRALECEIFNHTYTGRLSADLAGADSKGEIIDLYCRANSISLDSTAAFGDSQGDISMFKKVRVPVAVNPDKSLIQIANDNQWFQISHEGEDQIQKIRGIMEKTHLM